MARVGRPGSRLEIGPVIRAKFRLSQAFWSARGLAMVSRIFANHVGRLVLRLVVGARLHLGEQPQRDELDAA